MYEDLELEVLFKNGSYRRKKNWAEHSEKNAPTAIIHLYNKTTIENFYRTHCFHQTLPFSVVICSDQWHMACLISTFHHLKIPNIAPIRE